MEEVKRPKREDHWDHNLGYLIPREYVPLLEKYADHLEAQNQKLLEALRDTTALARIKYGNLDADVDKRLTESEELIKSST